MPTEPEKVRYTGDYNIYEDHDETLFEAILLIIIIFIGAIFSPIINLVERIKSIKDDE